MFKTLTESDFIAEFELMSRGDQFGYDSLCAIYEHMEECCPDWELDVIGICCEFAEYSDETELQQAYGDDDTEEFDWDEWVDYLNDKTTVLVHSGGLTLVSF